MQKGFIRRFWGTNRGTSWEQNTPKQGGTWCTSERTVAAVFGCRQQQLVGHGRAPGDVPSVEDVRIVHHARMARSGGLQFLYLLNGRCEHLDLSDGRDRAHFFADLEWIAEDVRADCVVVADLRVAKLIRSRYSSRLLPMRVSTVAGVMEPNTLEGTLDTPIRSANIRRHADNPSSQNVGACAELPARRDFHDSTSLGG
jgi:hypothetical protein